METFSEEYAEHNFNHEPMDMGRNLPSVSFLERRTVFPPLIIWPC
jgi:hypothetical protein